MIAFDIVKRPSVWDRGRRGLEGAVEEQRPEVAVVGRDLRAERFLAWVEHPDLRVEWFRSSPRAPPARVRASCQRPWRGQVHRHGPGASAGGEAERRALSHAGTEGGWGNGISFSMSVKLPSPLLLKAVTVPSKELSWYR
jgi:hypothetical protein